MYNSIFLSKANDGIYSPGNPLDSYSSNYYLLAKPKRVGPPVNCESYYISPHHEDVYKAAINIFVKIIKDICK